MVRLFPMEVLTFTSVRAAARYILHFNAEMTVGTLFLLFLIPDET
jgi:hypothetical protein